MGLGYYTSVAKGEVVLGASAPRIEMPKFFNEAATRVAL